MKKKYPTKLTDPDFDVTAYGKDLTATLMTEFFKIVDAEDRSHGKEFAEKLLLDFLASYICTMVYNSVTYSQDYEPNMTKEQIFEKTASLFSSTKKGIEEAIEHGFTKAFEEFDPEAFPEYQCNINCLSTGYEDGSTN